MYKEEEKNEKQQIQDTIIQYYTKIIELFAYLRDDIENMKAEMEKLKVSNEKHLKEINNKFEDIKLFFDDYKTLKSVVQLNCYNIDLLQSREICPLKKEK